MTRAQLKAMGVRVPGVDRVTAYCVAPKAWCVCAGGTTIAHPFPTRKAAEQYARDLRRAMRGDP